MLIYICLHAFVSQRLVAKGNTGIVNSARHEFDSAASRVLFSSTGCSYDDLFTNMGFDSGHLTSSKETENSPSVASRQDGFEAFTFTSSLKPLKDSFLINVQSSLNAPIFQMFPELEGYTGSIVNAMKIKI